MNVFFYKFNRHFTRKWFLFNCSPTNKTFAHVKQVKINPTLYYIIAQYLQGGEIALITFKYLNFKYLI